DLHQTYGIPIEVTEGIATDHNLRIDREGFKKAQDEHSQVSRGTTEAAAVFTSGPLDTLKGEYHHGSDFLGYETTQAEGRVIGVVEQGKLADSAKPNGESLVILVLDRTPFYGESGGQVGDTGLIRGDRFVFHVHDTKKENDFTLHVGHVIEGTVTVNDKV